MTKLTRSVAALAVIVGLLGVTVTAVRISYGAYKPRYALIGTFERVPYGMQSGAAVEHLGISVGHVAKVALVDGRAEIRLDINSGFQVPADVTAVIRPRSIFGDPYVDLDFAPTPSGPFLARGARIQRTSVDAQIGDLVASLVPVLRAVNGPDLATIIDQLARANQDESPVVRASIENGTQLAAFFASTINAQLQALDSFTRFQAALAPTGPTLNAIAANSNEALPTLNAAEADFQRALDALTPFAEKLAAFLAVERPDITRLLEAGDNVARLLTMREPQIEQVVSGLATYVFKFAAGRGPETLPNGTKFAYFKSFVLFSDVNTLICNVLAQGGATTAPILAALARAGTPIDCIRAPGVARAPNRASAAASNLAQGVDAIVGAPEIPQRLTVWSLVQHILGRS